MTEQTREVLPEPRCVLELAETKNNPRSTPPCSACFLAQVGSAARAWGVPVGEVMSPPKNGRRCLWALLSLMVLHAPPCKGMALLAPEGAAAGDNQSAVAIAQLAPEGAAAGSNHSVEVDAQQQLEQAQEELRRSWLTLEQPVVTHASSALKDVIGVVQFGSPHFNRIPTILRYRPVFVRPQPAPSGALKE